jgi:16S rRNA processing protein RimM
MGVIGRPHGVRGLMHVHSYTADPADLARYSPLADDRGRLFALRWHSPGVAAISEVVDGKRVPVADRATAEKLVNVRLYADRARLAPPAEDEFYLSDLIGMHAVGPDGAALGAISAVHDYGAGASLEIGPLLVPFTRACVPSVDLAAGRATVVPPAEIEGDRA